MDHFKQISTLVEVARHGSLSAAARAEGVAPAIIGRRLDALETRLGVKLLQRTTRRIVPTVEGKTFLDDCTRILGELSAAESAVSQGSQQATGRLLISAPAGFGRQHIAPLIGEFLARHPDLRLALDLTDRMVDVVGERIDVAVRIAERTDSNLVGVRLANNRRVICASPVYLERHGTPQTPDALQHHNWLTLGAPSSQQHGWTLLVAGQPQLIRVSGNMICNDGSVLHQWTLDGHGLAWRSLWEVGRDLAAGRLISVLDDYAAGGGDVYAVFAQRRHLPLRIRVFVDYLKARFADKPGWA